MRKEDASTATGISLPGIVFIVFLILKLTNLIGWSWWWVTSPLWIAAALTILILAVYAVLLLSLYRKYKKH